MIIGEKNLIIGKIFTIISNFCSSTFFYIQPQINFILLIITKLIDKIVPTITSPPKILL